MAQCASMIDKTEVESLSDFAEQVSDSQTALDGQFTKVQALLRKFNKLGIDELDDIVGVQNVIEKLDKTTESLEDCITFLKNSKDQLMKTSLNVYKATGLVQKRDSRGRKRDSGVYSVDSAVLGSSPDPRASSDSSFVAQATDDVTEPAHDTHAPKPAEHDESDA